MEGVWQAITTAPVEVELELSIYDKGEYHALAFPCRRDGLGWRDVRAGRWRPCARKGAQQSQKRFNANVKKSDMPARL